MVLGVEPELVLILELNRPIDPDTMGPRGLFVLEATDDTMMVAFASDLELTRFLSDLDRYFAGPLAGKRSSPLLGIFDAITEVREIGPDDVIDNDLQEGMRLCASDQIMRLDIECWCPEDEPEARRRFEEVLRTVARVGMVVDRSCRPVVGFSMIRADVPAAAVRQIADTTRVRRINRLPRPVLSHVEVNRAGAPSLPDALAPARDAPLLAVIDSGVRSEHPLLRPAVVDMLSLGTLDAITDESGHGTMVAGLALDGSLEERLRARHPVRSVGRMISIRVLDRDCSFSDDRIWQEDVARALGMAGARGARVVNPVARGRPSSLPSTWASAGGRGRRRARPSARHGRSDQQRQPLLRRLPSCRRDRQRVPPLAAR
ncbi:MAG: S8 family serine peptidase [Pseudonocardia sp.]